MQPAQTGFSSIIVTDGDTPSIRYTSGLTIYDEALIAGRWVGRYWSATGFVEPEPRLTAENNLWAEDRGLIFGLDTAAFELELDGQSLHFGWELIGMRETQDLSLIHI